MARDRAEGRRVVCGGGGGKRRQREGTRDGGGGEGDYGQFIRRTFLTHVNADTKKNDGEERESLQCHYHPSPT